MKFIVVGVATSPSTLASAQELEDSLRACSRLLLKGEGLGCLKGAWMARV